jgi:hypothetical protein
LATDPTPLADLCRRLDIENESRASNMLVTVKRWFQAAPRNRMRSHVADDDEVESEIRELMGILSRPSNDRLGRAGSGTP